MLLVESINGADTVWTEHSRSSFTECAYSIVPAVITEPLMATATFASWADSGVIQRDTLDTCVVNVCKEGYCNTYSIDMKAGLVIAAIYTTPDGKGNHTQVYYYGEYEGIFYLRKVCCGWPPQDTTLNTGGYEFTNIRVNGIQVTPVAIQAKSKPVRFSFQRLDMKRGSIMLGGTAGPVRAALFDIRGRRITPGYREVSNQFEINRLCPSNACPTGSLLLRIETGAGTKSFPVMIVR